ncbi:MAG: alpha/beta hydrolase [Proteobacteria bacterium]|nr:alpha/beta hydrolase [Pseudomonadota bacterium]
MLLVPGLSAGPFGFTVGGERSLVGALAAAGRSVWTVDLGYSVNSPTRQDFSAVVESVRRAIDVLDRRAEAGNDWAPDAVGHSLGGHVMLALTAVGAPIRRLATIATALDYRKGGSAWTALSAPARLGKLEARRRSARGGIPVELLSTLTWPLFGRAVPMPFQENNFHRGATDGPRIREVVARSMRDIPLPLLASLAGLVLPEGLTWGDPKRSLTDAVADIEVPVLVVGGRQDRQCPVEAVRHAAATIPGARLLEVGEDRTGLGFGHYDVVTGTRAPEQVFGPVVDFLS